MSGKLAIDTNIAIKFLNGDKHIDNFLSKYSEIYLPVIVAGELIFGALNSKHSEQNLLKHKKLIDRAGILEITKKTANTYAETRLFLKKNGKPIPENDLWIASICIEHKISFVSADEHFKDIEHLMFEYISINDFYNNKI